MLKTFREALKVKDVRNKIIYTFFALIVVRIGASLPIPGVDRNVFTKFFEEQNAMSFFDVIYGVMLSANTDMVELSLPCQYSHLALHHISHHLLSCSC